MAKQVPSYTGTLRNHSLTIPACVSECSGIRIFGRRIKSLAFSTDVAIIKNINADAIIAVYPFTPQPVISQAIISVSDVPVFVGVGGGITTGSRSVRLAIQSEHQGAYGVVLNAPTSDDVIRQIKKAVDIPVVITVVSAHTDIGRRHAGDRGGDPPGLPEGSHHRHRRPHRGVDPPHHPGRSQCHYIHPALQRRAVRPYHEPAPEGAVRSWRKIFGGDGVDKRPSRRL